MRRALIVGINNYPTAALKGCVNDAKKISEILKCDEDDTPNFDCKTIIGPPNQVTKAMLKENVKKLFDADADVALFYFSGHGTKNIFGGYLATVEAKEWDEGISMLDILTLANKATIREIIIILDCCYSGKLGSDPNIGDDKAILREGISILTASRGDESAIETDGGGVFTSLVCDALTGGAADVCGNVTVAGIYDFIDQGLGAWDQRPLLKAHVSKLIPIRRCKPQVEIEILRRLPEYFSDYDVLFQLDPSFEPTSNNPNEINTEIFADLKKLRDAGIIIVEGAESLYDAAMNSKGCRLAPKGRFYWRQAKSERL